MATTPTVTRNPQQQGNNQQAAAPAIPFVRAARRKSIQAFTGAYALGASVVPVAPIELPAAGFLRDIEMLISVATTGNAATVANPGGTLNFPWNIINSLMVTNAAGDTIYVPITGYDLYIINKWYGIYEPPFNDPRNDPAFVALTTGAGATAPTGSWLLRIPFELDPRDAFCALPNLAANKAYQLLINLSALSTIYAGGTAPNGTTTVTITLTMNYWSQPNPVNGAGQPQETAPPGVGSVSLFRKQTVGNVGGGNRVTQLINVGNVIRCGHFYLDSTAANNPRTDADFPTTNYIRLNNDQLFLKPILNWRSNMRKAFGYGPAVAANDTAGGLDTGIYVLSDFMEQHGKVTVDGPRDQYLVTVDATLLQHEGNVFGGAANTLAIITNEIKPARASALYSTNVV